MNNHTGRLDGKVAVITGAAGEIGVVIAKRFLQEDAKIILTGRTEKTLSTLALNLAGGFPEKKENICFYVMDGSLSESVQDVSQQVGRRFSTVDILVNNAGSVGAKQRLENIPITHDDLESLRMRGTIENELLSDSMSSLLLGPWLTTKYFLPYLGNHASIINVSTIFSRFEYYGRIPYVVPKAALNSLTQIMAVELQRDPRQLRINTVQPGPVITDRILTAFATMDKIRNAPENTTHGEIVNRMLLRDPTNTSNYVTKEDVANTILFLGSDESRQYTAQTLEVTRGFQVQDEGVVKITSLPELSTIDLDHRLLWLCAKDQFTEVFRLGSKFQQLGAEVLITFPNEKALEIARKKLESTKKENHRISVQLFDPKEFHTWQKIILDLNSKNFSGLDVVVLSGNSESYGSSVFDLSIQQIRSFIDLQIFESIAIAQKLSQTFLAFDKLLTSDPSITFLTNVSMQIGPFDKIKSVAIRELIRVWRKEVLVDIQNGNRIRNSKLQQLILSESSLPYEEILGDILLHFSTNKRQFESIDVIPDSTFLNSPLSQSKRFECYREHGSIYNILKNKVALITGGAEGIGGEISRQLLLAGAKVAIAERNITKLENARDRFTKDLNAANYHNVDGRIFLIPDCNVTKKADLENLIHKVIYRFGRIDYLINNAGLTGSEEMIVDMAPETWNETLYGNMISNYHLILAVLPFMKAQGYGHIINMSSYFAGSRHGFLPYSNRSDYIVSKAGQIALTEALAKSIGPEIQINALAPGPVNGARLNGTQGRPGLYYRRAVLLLENKRLNAVHCAILNIHQRHEDVEKALDILSMNDIKKCANIKEFLPLYNLARSILELQNEGKYSSCNSFLTRNLSRKLIGRLRSAGILKSNFDFNKYLDKVIEPPVPFFSEMKIKQVVDEISEKNLQRLALGRMPTDRDLAGEVFFTLIQKTITGEVLYPSSGFVYEGLPLAPSFRFDGEKMELQEILEDSRDHLSGSVRKSIMIFGNSMFKEMAQLAFHLSKRRTDDNNGSPRRRINLFAMSELGKKTLENFLKELGADKLNISVEYGRSSVEVLDEKIPQYGEPDVIISFPLKHISLSYDSDRSEWENLPSLEQFENLIDSCITSHLRLGKRASLIDHCRVFLVTPRPPEFPNPSNLMMTKFLNRILIPLTLTMGKEACYLSSKSVFFQVDGGISPQILANNILAPTKAIKRGSVAA